MLNIIEDIIPLSNFRQQASDIIKKIQVKRRPTFITINGKVEAVLQDAKSYQTMLTRIEELEALLMNSGDMIYTTNNYDKPMEEVFKDIQKKLGNI
ncbi:MAG: type II toxin-antitoxin system Phd/YefM family antitoxin [Alphaproteobacteria bacterium]|nr:type II toxin-antitoxin system Phd/YefM family antitoxin [Alphaproteobacteria bacterium]